MECLAVARSLENKFDFLKKIIQCASTVRSHSSVGLERLPAKEEVAGSSPAGCTISYFLGF